MLRFRMPVGLLLASMWAQGAEVAVAQDKAGAQPAPAVDARTLGMAEGLLDYCTEHDPAGAAKVRARVKQLTQGASKQALAAARTSREYQSARDSEAAFVGKVDPRNARRLCSQSPPARQQKGKAQRSAS